jgi:thiol:disulfide interchange protein
MPPGRFSSSTATRGPLAASLAALAVVAGAGCEIRDEAAAAAASRALGLEAGPSAAAPGAIEYVEGYAAGLRRSTGDNRPLLIVFKARWCRWCAEFTEATLTNRRVVGLSRQFVCVLIDADRHADDCRRFAVREFPTLVVARPGGEELHRWVGCPSPDEIAAGMEGTLPATRLAAAAGDAADSAR